MTGTHEGICRVGLGARFFFWGGGGVLSEIAVSSLSPGSCPSSLYYIVGLYNVDFSSSYLLQVVTSKM